MGFAGVVIIERWYELPVQQHTQTAAQLAADILGGDLALEKRSCATLLAAVVQTEGTCRCLKE